MWKIDVGIEFSEENQVIAWQRGGHSRALSVSFPSATESDLSGVIEDHDARAIPSTRDAYRLDAVSSLDQVAGFFFNALHPKASSFIDENDPISACAYTTDKTMFVKRGSESTGPFSTPSCSGVASKDKFEKKIALPCFNIIRLLTEAGRLSSSDDTNDHDDDNDGDDDDSRDHVQPRQLGAARLEVRVDVARASEVLISVPPDFRKDCLYAFDPQIWWWEV